MSHKLDVFEAGGRSESTTRLHPALVFFHGGVWSSGYPWWTSFMAPGVNAAGGVLVAPTHRLGPEHRFPAQLHDVAAAIAWVWTNAERIGVDRNRIVVGGHSSGGHLSALAALHPDALGGAGVSGRIVKACLPVSCSFNVHYPDAAPESGEVRVYRTLLARPEDDQAASPVSHLDHGAPPFHIVYGDSDYPWIRRTSAEMAEAMRQRRQRVQVEEWAGADHFDTHLALKDPRHPWYDRLAEAFAAAREASAC